MKSTGNGAISTCTICISLWFDYTEVLFMVFSGYYWEVFERVCIPCSDHCKDGARTCDTYTGDCRECEDKWFGDKCQTRCEIQKCLQCSQPKGSVICSKCETGFFPSDGQCVSCSTQHCIGDCNSTDGTCPNGCVGNWYGGEYKCNLECTQWQCLKCTVDSKGLTACSRCNSSYYVSMDLRRCLKCPSNCNSDGICADRYGSCTAGCVAGYYGPYCNETCSPHCVGGECAFDSGSCTCQEGWFGRLCDRNCPLTCVNCFDYRPGLCSACEAGTYGDVCEKKCNINCKATQVGYQYCDKVTGKCANGCMTGYYGDLCEDRCSTCLADCERDSGVCLSGCIDGYYGPACNIPCPRRCTPISKGYERTCNPFNGSCELGCKSGYTGSHCDMTCSDFCISRTCDSNGVCTYGCTQGYGGEKCDINCQTNDCSNVCGENCNQNLCTPSTMTCTHGCKSGWWKNNCKERCTNCLQESCDQFTGTCNSACISGFYGQQCDKECSIYCNDEECNRLDGRQF